MVGSGTSYIGTAMGSIETSVAINVSSSVSISVSPTLADVVVTHQDQTFTATVKGSTNTAVTWVVDGADGSDSTVGTISNSCVYTPPSTAGTQKITATSHADLGKSATAEIAVMDVSGVYTRQYDNARTGLGSDAIGLNPQNVNAQQFGAIASYPVKGIIFAQPLYVANVNVPNLGYRHTECLTPRRLQRTDHVLI